MVILLIIVHVIVAEEVANQVDSSPTDSAEVEMGVMKNCSEFFRTWYHNNDLIHYLDNYNNFATVQQETTGDYALSNRMIFSLAGNSFEWNRFYLDGFRIDSRFFAGSTFYNLDLYRNSINVDYLNSNIRLESDKTMPNCIELTGNMGGLGGVMPGTKELINLFHKASYERLYKLINFRSHMAGAGSARASVNLYREGTVYAQQLYFEYGKRNITGFDYNGITSLFDADNYKLQLMGQLPIVSDDLFDTANYLVLFQRRNDMNSEFYYNQNELARHDTYTASLFGKKNIGKLRYTMGLTWATNVVRLHNQEFSRNMIDQDGEAFEPWQPDGATTELSLAFACQRELTSWLSLNFDSYNSMIYFNPRENYFRNTTYVEYPRPDDKAQYPYTSLYLYDWTTKGYIGGLLENQLSLRAEKQLTKWLALDANIDFTLDAMLIDNKSIVSPNWQAQMKLRANPCRWFAAELNMGNYRVAYNIGQMQYFSDDYLNANIYYWNDKNGDKAYQSGESGSLFATTGGKQHTTGGKYLQQMNYFVFDIPVYFIFGRHHISFMQSYRKYYNMWSTRYKEDITTIGDMQANETWGTDMFVTKGGASANYIVENGYQEGIMGDNILNNTPYYASSIIKYRYQGPKVTFSLAWQSFQMCGVSAMGFGPLHNNVGVLSESMANPNTFNNVRNSESPYRALGRLDQDRAYVAWMLLTYNINRYISFTLNGKFRDGQAFTAYKTHLVSESEGENQLIMMPASTRGINTMDGHFGTRDDAFFNFDLSATGYIPFKDGSELMLQLTCYNIFDSATELTEYIMGEPIAEKRYAMSLCVPRGLMFTASYCFDTKRDKR